MTVGMGIAHARASVYECVHREVGMRVRVHVTLWKHMGLWDQGGYEGAMRVWSQRLQVKQVCAADKKAQGWGWMASD